MDVLKLCLDKMSFFIIKLQNTILYTTLIFFNTLRHYFFVGVIGVNRTVILRSL